MKHARLMILAFGALGVVSLFLPVEGHTMFEALRALGGGYMAAVFGGLLAAGVMGGLASTRPPMQHWQKVVATAGFAGAFVRIKLWQDLGDVLDQPLPSQLLALAILGGIAASITSFIRRD